MCAQKVRPIDGFQRVINSFKHFENKLDKLQEDMNYQGKTLSELSALVLNLSGATVVSADGKASSNKRYVNKTTAIQYEDKVYLGTPKTKKGNIVCPKLKVKSFQTQKSKLSPRMSPFQVRRNKLDSGSKGMTPKHSQRHKKTDAQRKANTIRPTQKMIEKKRSRPAK